MYYIEVWDYYPWIYAKADSLQEAELLLIECKAKELQAAIIQMD